MTGFTHLGRLIQKGKVQQIIINSYVIFSVPHQGGKVRFSVKHQKETRIKTGVFKTCISSSVMEEDSVLAASKRCIVFQWEESPRADPEPFPKNLQSCSFLFSSTTSC